MSNSDSLLRAENIVKRYPGVLANDRISLEVRAGEIHAILGENGAGKSTLMNILYGLTFPDEGKIFWRNEPVRLRHTRDAIRLGIGMVHQHLSLVPSFNSIENLALQEYSFCQSPWLSMAKLRKKSEMLCRQFCFDLPLTTPVGALSLGAQQKLEILKAFVAEADLLIMDEPTGLLAPSEVDDLFLILRRFVSQRKSVFLISHKLPEVKAVSDRISILRQGRLIRTVEAAKSEESELIRDIVGGAALPSLQIVSLKSDRPRPVALKVEMLSASINRRKEWITDMCFQVRAGEIFGVAGVEGNGQRPLFDVLTGMLKPSTGQIQILGNDVSFLTPNQLRKMAVGIIPEDRQKNGLLLDRSGWENLILQTYSARPFSVAGWLVMSSIRAKAKQLFAQFDIRASSIDDAIGNLSGGNQQKIILARTLQNDPKLLIIANPARGLDVRATEYVYYQIAERRAKGAAILLISSDLDEIFSLCDRIAVLYRGTLIPAPAGSNRELVGRLMSGLMKDDTEPSNGRARSPS